MSEIVKEKKGIGAKYQSVLMVLVLGLAGFLCWQFAMAAGDSIGWYKQSKLRMIAPNFEPASLDDAPVVPDFVLKDRFGNDIRLSQFEKVDLLVVNIWASTCPVCRDEVPELTEMDRRLGKLGNAALLTIAVDKSFADVASFFPKGTDLRILFDPDDKVAKGIFKTTKYPETFVLDKKRRIRARFDGKRPWHDDAMFGYLSQFI